MRGRSRRLPSTAEWMLERLRGLRCGSLTVVLPDGARHCLSSAAPGPAADIAIHNRRVFAKTARAGGLGFAQSYMDGDFDSSDLGVLLELLARNYDALGPEPAPGLRLWLAGRLTALARANTRRGSRRNIAFHYDLGEDFYASWLDPSLSYSCAIFDRPAQTLEQAQQAKYARIASLLDLRPGQRVLEVGCGWGAFACLAAERYGVHVTALTISRRQYEHARRAVSSRGLGGRVEVRLQDYRDVRGGFDAVAAIEVLEAIGERYWPAFFACLRDRLREGGRAAVQTITIADSYYASYRRRPDFIQRYIFPGGMLPSRAAIDRAASEAGLGWMGEASFGSHYARTLSLWRQRFESAWPKIAALGFDSRFQRTWRYYLCYCEAGFRTGSIDLLQIALRRQGADGAPAGGLRRPAS